MMCGNRLPSKRGLASPIVGSLRRMLAKRFDSTGILFVRERVWGYFRVKKKPAGRYDRARTCREWRKMGQLEVSFCSERDHRLMSSPLLRIMERSR